MQSILAAGSTSTGVVLLPRLSHLHASSFSTSRQSIPRVFHGMRRTKASTMLEQRSSYQASVWRSLVSSTRPTSLPQMSLSSHLWWSVSVCIACSLHSDISLTCHSSYRSLRCLGNLEQYKVQIVPTASVPIPQRTRVHSTLHCSLHRHYVLLLC